MRESEIKKSEGWQRSVLTLPDAVFFDLMRNYLGDISTPFNKHTLIGRLVKFLKRKVTRSRITALLGHCDRQILTVVKILGSPTFEGIYRVLEEGISYLDLQRALVNLERRLLLYREPQGQEIRLRLNPLLEGVVSRNALHPDILSVGCDVIEMDVERPWLGDSLLTAFLSYALHSGLPVRKSGTLTGRSEEAILKIFPALKTFEEGRSRLDILKSSLENLGLLEQRGGVLEPDLAEWKRMAGIDAGDALAFLWSAGATGGGSVPIGKFAGLLKIILANLSATKAVDATSMRRLCTIAALRNMEKPGDLPSAEEIAEFVRHLRRLGILISAVAGMGMPADFLVLNPHARPLVAGGGNGGKLTVQPNFEVTLTPEVRLLKGLPVALTCQIRSFDLVCSYELNRDSFKNYLNLGYRADELLESLKHATQNSLPQNVLVTLRTWQQEFEALTLYEGIVLTVIEKKRELLEHLLKPYISRKLAGGVYLLDSKEEKQWRGLLVRSGFEYVPQVKRISGRGEDHPVEKPLLESVGPLSGDLFPVWDYEPGGVKQGSAGRKHGSDEAAYGSSGAAYDSSGAAYGSSGAAYGSAGDERAADEIRSGLLVELESVSDRFSPQQLDEVRRRIEGRLILLKDLVRPIAGQGEMNEAKGLDYLGKVRLIEQAIKERSALEIIERTLSGRPRKLEMKPLRIEKTRAQSPTRSDLVLVGRVIPTGEEMGIKVSKMGLVRRIPSSLLGGF